MEQSRSARVMKILGDRLEARLARIVRGALQNLLYISSRVEEIDVEFV